MTVLIIIGQVCKIKQISSHLYLFASFSSSGLSFFSPNTFVQGILLLQAIPEALSPQNDAICQQIQNLTWAANISEVQINLVSELEQFQRFSSAEMGEACQLNAAAYVFLPLFLKKSAVDLELNGNLQNKII